jgi:hypothetical protein
MTLGAKGLSLSLIAEVSSPTTKQFSRIFRIPIFSLFPIPAIPFAPIRSLPECRNSANSSALLAAQSKASIIMSLSSNIS